MTCEMAAADEEYMFSFWGDEGVPNLDNGNARTTL